MRHGCETNFEGSRGVGGPKVTVTICMDDLSRRHLELEPLHQCGEEHKELSTGQGLANADPGT